MTNVTPSFHHYAQADEDHKKLKYKKNSAFSVKLSQSEKNDPLNDFITIFLVVRKLKL